MKRTAVFDVCWTLYRSNTTVDFVLFYLKRESFYRYVFFRLLTIRVVSVLLRIAGIKDMRERIILQLKGESKSSLDKVSKDFYNEFLIKKINEPIFVFFEKCKNDGLSVFLASASLDIVVGQIAKQNNIDFISSKLGFSNDICTGKLEVDTTGNKYFYLEKSIGSNTLDVMYSDNLEDREMKAYFKSFYFVHNSRFLKKSEVVRIK